MTLKEAIERLAEAGVDSPEYDAREIFSHIGGICRAELTDRSISCDLAAVKEAVERRSAREPLQYIIGECGFYRETYTVTPDCLIPRADTELLVDLAVKKIPEGESLLDLCTGSGCVAISTLNNTRHTRCLAVDISEGALAVARKNAERNGVADRLTLIRRDLLSEGLPEGSFFAILSNPPYIPAAVYEGLEKEIFHEPKEAFVGGEHGDIFYRAMTPECLKRLKPGGFIAYEIGYDQGELLREIGEELCCEVKILKDLSGNDRVALLTRKQQS